MGIERMLHAIPSNCELLAAFSRNAIEARDLLYYPMIMPHCARGPKWLMQRNEPPDIRERRVAFLELAKIIISSNPGIEHRGVDLDRRFGWLETLLLKIVENHDDRSVLKIALSGEAVIAEAEKNGLDFPIKWNMARTCREVGAALNDISLSELRAGLSAALKVDTVAYKWHTQDQAEVEEGHATVLLDFEQIRQLYTAAAEHSECVLICNY